ncbi:hypothetical protein Y032_0039g126 [Ancylostoma ceylanicum]|uniref:Ras-related protein Rab n=1 Tax=Ancylostoma ceylanicum TaxID=53326 RepID=A0A016UIR0_9BILA|nr:hypothetical protein Y032_0039g126 [Ancylostoma ceylanicum]
MTSTQEKKQYSFKILVIGDPATGKTSIIRRFVHNVFTANYKATIGVDFALKRIDVDDEVQVYLQLWDISGQDRYGVMNRVYYKDAHGAVVVMDVSRERTKEGACRWKNDLDQKVLLADGSQVPAVLVINKCDLDVNIDEKNLKELEEENRFIGVVRTSAKENYGIDEAILTVLRRVLENEKKGRYEASFPNSEGNVRIGDDKRQQKKKYGGCC